MSKAALQALWKVLGQKVLGKTEPGGMDPRPKAAASVGKAWGYWYGGGGWFNVI